MQKATMILDKLEEKLVHVTLKRLIQSGTKLERLTQLLNYAVGLYQGVGGTRRKKLPKAYVHQLTVSPTARAAERKTAASIWNTRLGGRMLSTLHWNELESLANKSEIDMRFAVLLKTHKNPETDNMKLTELYSAVEIAALMRKAETPDRRTRRAA